MAKIRREYAGGAVSTTTTAVLASTNASPVSLGINANTGWPFGSNKFFVVLEPGTANEEKVLVSRASSGDLAVVVASDSDRGLDGTTAITHASGSTIYPVFTSVDADEANELASLWESKGDLVSYGSSTFARLAVGTNDYVLQADSSTASGLAWGLVDTDNIAADAVTAAKIAAGAVDSAELASAAVTVEKLASAVVNRLVPAGTVVATVSASADAGWLLLDGSTVIGAQSSYPALWTVAPNTWKSGSNLVLPDMADHVLSGSGATTLGATGGANTVTIGTANLPVHTHSINHGHANTFAASHDHTHAIDPPSTTSGGPSDDVVERLVGYSGSYVIPYDGDNNGYADGVTYSPAPGGGMAVNGANFSHTHDLNIPSFTSGAASTSTVSVTGSVTNHTGNSGNGGFANTALNVRDAHLAVRFQIKAH